MKLPKVPVKAPGVDGYVVGMTASLVDRRGRAITIRDVMLHHIVFHRVRRSRRPLAVLELSGEPIYGTGEEKQDLRLPRGYGYRIRRADRWRITAMLMSHSEDAVDAYIRYRVTVIDRQAAEACAPVLGARQRLRRPGELPGRGRRSAGSTNTRSFDWKAPFNGRIVAVGGHLHGGAQGHVALAAALRRPPAARHRPRYGMPDNLYYRAKPILHEPGPVDTRYFLSRQGIPIVRGGDDAPHGRLRDRAPAPARDGDHARLRHARRARSRRRAGRSPPTAGSSRSTSGSRTEPPQVTVPLNRVGADGHTRIVETPLTAPSRSRTARPSTCATSRFNPGHVSVEAGASLTWRFRDSIAHNVLLANGPRLVGSPTLSGGARRRRASRSRAATSCSATSIR